MEYLSLLNGLLGLLTPVIVEWTAKNLKGMKKLIVALVWSFAATLVSLALQSKLNFVNVDEILGTLAIIFAESQVFWRTTWQNIFK